MDAHVISLANQKGGTAKTTTCANLGIGLAQAGRKVLLVDADAQGSLTLSLGWEPDELPITLYDLMIKAIQDKSVTHGEGMLHHEEGVDLLPANIELAGMEMSLISVMYHETILKQVLEPYKHEYDYILVAGHDDHQRAGSNGWHYCADDSAAFADKGHREVAGKRSSGQARNQSQPENRGDSDDPDGRANGLRARNQRDDSERIRRENQHLWNGDSALRAGGGNKRRGKEHLCLCAQKQGRGSLSAVDEGGAGA